MHRYLAVAAAALIAGCASTSNTTSTAQKPMEEKQYRVGSNIPVRDAAGASPTSTVDPATLRGGTPARTN